MWRKCNQSNELLAHHFSSSSCICDEVYLVLKDILILLSGELAILGPSLFEGPPNLIPFPVFLLLPGG